MRSICAPAPRSAGAAAAWNVSAFINHQDGYRDAVTNRGIESWTTADLQLGYTAPAGINAWMDGLRVALSVQNILDDEPPFFDNPVGFVGYDPENATNLGRFVSLQINKSW
ncbi:MAG: TonB-dependent receptor [Gammaproteobacteria bacterium]|nr:TonB-dependent receptor [Gammaproteobacteria bacterium]